MKKILVLSIGVAMLAVSARANIVVSTGKDNIAAGTPGTRTMLAGKDSYYLIYSLTTANAAASISTTANGSSIDALSAGVLLSSSGNLNTGNGGVGYYLFQVTNSAVTNIVFTYNETGAGNNTFAAFRIRSSGASNVLQLASNSSYADVNATALLSQTFSYNWSAYNTATTTVTEATVLEAGVSQTENYVANNPLMLVGPQQIATRMSYYTILTNTTSFSDTWTGTGTAAVGELRSFSFVETQVIPEPATIGMLGLGGISLLAFRRIYRR